MMLITDDYLNKHRSSSGGWTRSQILALGLVWPPTKGWKTVVLGKEISEANRRIFEAGLTAKQNRKARKKAKALKKLVSIADGKISRAALGARQSLNSAKRRSGLTKDKSPDPVQRTPELNVLAFHGKSSINPTADEFLSSFEWRSLRMMALKKHGARCQCCGASPATGAVMHVDHIKPRKFFPELALDLDNLQVLCGDCNHGKGNWDTTDWRALG
jgi:hypothetical protein